MKNRTPEEITRQIEGLKKMKTTIPERSHFGDENWAQIDAQLDILEDKAELDSFFLYSLRRFGALALAQSI